MSISDKSLNGILAQLEAAEIRTRAAITDALSEAGDYVTERIRNGEMSEWIHHSYNLVSSIGYAVSCRGNIAKISGFEAVQGGTEGAAKGRELAEKLARESHADYALFVVAGEDYAVFVEAIENKVVLSSAFLYLEKNVPANLRDKIRKALNR